MNKAIFLDRDGVLNDDPGYVHKIKDFKFLPHVVESLKRLNEYEFFIISNQSGIGRGYYSEKDYHVFNDHLVNELKKQGVIIEKSFYCPHHPDVSCDCRKPSPKFIKEASDEYDIDLNQSYMIGDHASDIGAGHNAGCKTIYLLSGHGVKHLDEARKEKPGYVAANIKQAADFILFNSEDKIIERRKLADLIRNIRGNGKKIVTINGTFDILHKGHEKILNEAKKQGDVLIVGVNSDRSVRKNKGETRPVNSEFNRAKMLANFAYVDFVTIFDEQTPIQMLEIIKPDVHVNGSEYGKQCIEASTVEKNGGRVYIIKLIKGFSTSRIIGE